MSGLYSGRLWMVLLYDVIFDPTWGGLMRLPHPNVTQFDLERMQGIQLGFLILFLCHKEFSNIGILYVCTMLLK